MRTAIMIMSIMCMVGIMPHTVSVVYAQEQKECSRKDQTRIKSFNSKAKSKQKEYNKVMENIEKMKTIADANRMRGKLAKIENFFKSPEYRAMQPVYERCGASMPQLNK